MATNVKNSENVMVLTSEELCDLVNEIGLSNVVLRDKRIDRHIVLKRVPVFSAKEKITLNELKNAWRCMYFKVWTIKAEIEAHTLRDARTGNIFRNLDRFDVVMYVGGKIVFDTADFNLELVEGKIGFSPKSKVLNECKTNKERKVLAYTFADSGWELLTLDAKVSEKMDKMEAEEIQEEKERKEKAERAKAEKDAKQKAEKDAKEKAKKEARKDKTPETVENAA